MRKHFISACVLILTLAGAVSIFLEAIEFSVEQDKTEQEERISTPVDHEKNKLNDHGQYVAKVESRDLIKWMKVNSKIKIVAICDDYHEDAIVVYEFGGE